MEGENTRRIERLVLAYLYSYSCEDVFLRFCKYSEFLQEEYNQLLDGLTLFDIPNAGNLIQIYKDFSEVQTLVQRAESSAPMEKRRMCQGRPLVFKVQYLSYLFSLSDADMISQFAIGKRRRQSLGVDAQRCQIDESENSFRIEEKRRRVGLSPRSSKSVKIVSPRRCHREEFVRNELRPILKARSYSNNASRLASREDLSGPSTSAAAALEQSNNIAVDLVPEEPPIPLSESNPLRIHNEASTDNREQKTESPPDHVPEELAICQPSPAMLQNKSYAPEQNSTIAPDPEVKPETETRTNSSNIIIKNIPKDVEAPNNSQIDQPNLDPQMLELVPVSSQPPLPPCEYPAKQIGYQPPLPPAEPIITEPSCPSAASPEKKAIPLLRHEYPSPYETDSTVSHSATTTTSGSSLEQRLSLDAHLSPIQSEAAAGPEGKTLEEVLHREIFENNELAEMLASNINSIFEDDVINPAQDANEATANESKKSEGEQLEDAIRTIMARAEKDPVFDEIIHGIGAYLPMGGAVNLNKSVPGLMTASTPHKIISSPPHRSEGSRALNTDPIAPSKPITTVIESTSAATPEHLSHDQSDSASPSPKASRRVLRPRQLKNYTGRKRDTKTKDLLKDETFMDQMRTEQSLKKKWKKKTPQQLHEIKMKSLAKKINSLDRTRNEAFEKLKVNIISNETFEGRLPKEVENLLKAPVPAPKPEVEPVYTYVLEEVIDPVPLDPWNTIQSAMQQIQPPIPPIYAPEMDPSTSTMKQRLVIKQPHGCNYPMFNPNPIAIPTPVAPPRTQQVEYIIDIPANIMEQSPIKECTDADLMIPDSISKLIIPYSTKKFHHHRTSLEYEEEKPAAQQDVSTDKENSVPAAEKATQTPKLMTTASQLTKCASSPRRSHVRVLNFDTPSKHSLRSPRQPSTLPKLNDSNKATVTTPVIHFTKSPRSTILTRSATKIKKETETPKVPKRIRKRLLNQPTSATKKKEKSKKEVVPIKKEHISPKKEVLVEVEEPKPKNVMEEWQAMREAAKSKDWDNQIRLHLSTLPAPKRVPKRKVSRKKIVGKKNKEPVEEESLELVVDEAKEEQQEGERDNSLGKELAKEMNDFLLNQSEDCVDVSVTDVSKLNDTVVDRGDLTILDHPVAESNPIILPNLEASLVKDPPKVNLPNLDASVTVDQVEKISDDLPRNISAVSVTREKVTLIEKEKIKSETNVESQLNEDPSKDLKSSKAKPDSTETVVNNPTVNKPEIKPPKTVAKKPTSTEREVATKLPVQGSSKDTFNAPPSTPVPLSPKIKLMSKTRSGDNLPIDMPTKTPVNYISPPPSTPALFKGANESHLLLETPCKEGLHLIPPTPGFAMPHLTPATKIVKTIINQNVSVLKCSDIPTPDFAITPGVNVTPERPDSPRAKRPTDYSSSGSSYYKPDDSDDLNKILDARLAAARKKTKSESDTLEGVLKVVVEEEEEIVVTETLAEVKAEEVALEIDDPVADAKSDDESSSSSDESNSEWSSSDESRGSSDSSGSESEMDISDEENDRSINGSKRRLIAENGILDQNNEIRFPAGTPRKDGRESKLRKSTQSPQVSSSSCSSSKPDSSQPVPGPSSQRAGTRVASTKATASEGFLADLKRKQQRTVENLKSEQVPMKKIPNCVTIIHTKPPIAETETETRISSTSSKRKSATPRKCILLEELPSTPAHQNARNRNNSGGAEVVPKSAATTSQPITEKPPHVSILTHTGKVPLTYSHQKAQFLNVFGDMSDSETDPTPMKKSTQEPWKTPKVVEKVKPTRKSPDEVPKEAPKKTVGGKKTAAVSNTPSTSNTNGDPEKIAQKKKLEDTVEGPAPKKTVSSKKTAAVANTPSTSNKNVGQGKEDRKVENRVEEVPVKKTVRSKEANTANVPSTSRNNLKQGKAGSDKTLEAVVSKINTSSIETSTLRNILETVHSNPTCSARPQAKKDQPKEKPVSKSEKLPNSMEEDKSKSIGKPGLTDQVTSEASSSQGKLPKPKELHSKPETSSCGIVHPELKLPITTVSTIGERILVDSSDLDKKESSRTSKQSVDPKKQNAGKTKSGSKVVPKKASSSESSSTSTKRTTIEKAKQEKKMQDYFATETAIRCVMQKAMPRIAAAETTTEQKEDASADRPSKETIPSTESNSRSVKGQGSSNDKMTKEISSKNESFSKVKEVPDISTTTSTAKSTKGDNSTNPEPVSKPKKKRSGKKSVFRSQEIEAAVPTRLLPSQVEVVEPKGSINIQNYDKLADCKKEAMEIVEQDRNESVEEGEIVEEGSNVEPLKKENTPTNLIIDGAEEEDSQESKTESLDIVSFDESSPNYLTAAHDPKWKPSGEIELIRIDPVAAQMKIFVTEDSFARISVAGADIFELKPAGESNVVEVSSSSKKSTKVAKLSKPKGTPISSPSVSAIRSPIPNLKMDPDQINRLLNQIHGDK